LSHKIKYSYQMYRQSLIWFTLHFFFVSNILLASTFSFNTTNSILLTNEKSVILVNNVDTNNSNQKLPNQTPVDSEENSINDSEDSLKIDVVNTAFVYHEPYFTILQDVSLGHAYLQLLSLFPDILCPPPK
jgi:hypothetical protein